MRNPPSSRTVPAPVVLDGWPLESRVAGTHDGLSEVVEAVREMLGVGVRVLVGFSCESRVVAATEDVL